MNLLHPATAHLLGHPDNVHILDPSSKVDLALGTADFRKLSIIPLAHPAVFFAAHRTLHASLALLLGSSHSCFTLTNSDGTIFEPAIVLPGAAQRAQHPPSPSICEHSAVPQPPSGARHSTFAQHRKRATCRECWLYSSPQAVGVDDYRRGKTKTAHLRQRLQREGQCLSLSLQPNERDATANVRLLLPRHEHFLKVLLARRNRLELLLLLKRLLKHRLALLRKRPLTLLRIDAN
ncbi:hypothetical protein C8R46DRAFT_1222792 [Mycena filopes]|nr:hypothetical protein C8R46DRAFT_1222792 [Mycena filopes]